MSNQLLRMTGKSNDITALAQCWQEVYRLWLFLYLLSRRSIRANA